MRSMHDKRQPRIDTPDTNERSLESLIVDLETGDPAAAPDLADAIAARLEADLVAASAGVFAGETVAEQLPIAEEVADAT